jgi:hypothetical protein
MLTGRHSRNGGDCCLALARRFFHIWYSLEVVISRPRARQDIFQKWSGFGGLALWYVAASAPRGPAHSFKRPRLETFSGGTVSGWLGRGCPGQPSVFAPLLVSEARAHARQGTSKAFYVRLACLMVFYSLSSQRTSHVPLGRGRRGRAQNSFGTFSKVIGCGLLAL